MNCFQHRSLAAVGICKSCGKALCPSCAVEMNNGLACRDSCEPRVDLINRIIDSNARNLTVANRQLRSAAILIFTMGVCFLALAAVFYKQGIELLAMLLGPLGALFLISGLMRLRSGGYSDPSREPAPPDS